MTTLLIDRGNTCLKWQLIEARECIQQGVANKDDDLNAVFSELDREKILSIWVSSVANAVFEKELQQWAGQNNISPANFLQSEVSAFGLKNVYAEPTQLGVDRWLAMLGARKMYQGLLCVVDLGTACTLDLIAENGSHLGGYIVPGMSLMAKSLLSNTQRIVVDDDRKGGFLGRNTSQAVLLGVQQSLKGFIQQTLLDIEAKYNAPAKLVLTGGDCGNLALDLSSVCEYEPDLVFKGLQRYAEQGG